jgi:hypothetical protein
MFNNEGEYITIVWQKGNETLRNKFFDHGSKSKNEVEIKNFAEMQGIVLPEL